MATASKLAIDTNAGAMDMANEMFGTGINIVSAEYSGAASASGIYTGGDAAADALTPSDTGVILSTGTASDVTNASGSTNTSVATTTDHGGAGDSDLSAISGQTTYDAAVFEAEFIPDGSTLTMQIVFSSEEYLEFVDSGYNDAVGIWVNGEPATLTIGDGEISIDNINDESNENLYIDNAAGTNAYNTEMDGFTVTMTLKAPVNPGEVNEIKIGIADGGDGTYDSNVLIAGDSVQTALIAGDDIVDFSEGNPAELDVLANDVSATGSELTVTHINGQAVNLGDTVTLPTGAVVIVTDDGLEVDNSASNFEDANFAYTVEDEDGNTDSAFVTLTGVPPCFTAGTLIETDRGHVAVERLRVGDRVLTRDHGPQPIRWIAERRISPAELAAKPRFCAVLLPAGTLAPGVPLRDVRVSPQHRVLVRSAIAERMFGSAEVLVPAKDLVGLGAIRRCGSERPVRYVHLMCDRHEVIGAEGAEMETLFNGPEARAAVGQSEADVIAPPLSGGAALMTPARPFIRGRRARQLVARHARNNKPLVMGAPVPA